MHEADYARPRAGVNPKPREPRTWDDLGAAFARADREHRELQRLKATGKPYAALDFHPERLTEGG